MRAAQIFTMRPNSSFCHPSFTGLLTREFRSIAVPLDRSLQREVLAHLERVPLGLLCGVNFPFIESCQNQSMTL